jgi:hypothetical protein
VLVARRGGLPFDAPFTAWLQGLPLPVGFWEACTFLGGVFLLAVGAAFVVAALLAGRPRLAVIVAVPSASGVTIPFASILTIPAGSDVYSTLRVKSRNWPDE